LPQRQSTTNSFKLSSIFSCGIEFVDEFDPVFCILSEVILRNEECCGGQNFCLTYFLYFCTLSHVKNRIVIITIYYRHNRFCFDCGIPKPTVDEPTDFLSSGCSPGTRLSAVYLWFPSCRLHASAVQYVHVLSFWKRDRTSMASYTWEGIWFNCIYRIICIDHRDLHFANLPTPNATTITILVLELPEPFRL